MELRFLTLFVSVGIVRVCLSVDGGCAPYFKYNKV